MRKLLIFIPLIVVIFFSCMKSPDLDQLEANFLVTTSKASTADFTAYKTYYISDTLGLISDNPNDSLWVGSDALQLVNAVKSNMDARGYTLVPRSRKPDLGVSLTAIKNLNIGVIYPGYWYGGYYGGCYWGYCGYPPYYGYGYPVYYSITTGTLVIDLIDIKNAPAKKNWKFYGPLLYPGD